MKYLIKTTIILIFSLFSIQSFAMDPKLKILAESAGYGTVAGALLGTATLAFDGEGRNIAKGASLGLYAGIIFGGYIIVNYEMKKRGFGNESKGDYYPESAGPYENDQTNIVVDIADYRLAQFENKKDPKKDPKFFMNFLNYEF